MKAIRARGAYLQFSSPMKSYIFSGLMIVACAVPGALLARFLLSPLDLPRVIFALAVVFVAMVISVATFAGLIYLGRLFKIIE